MIWTENSLISLTFCSSSSKLIQESYLYTADNILSHFVTANCAISRKQLDRYQHALTNELNVPGIIYKSVPIEWPTMTITTVIGSVVPRNKSRVSHTYSYREMGAVVEMTRTYASSKRRKADRSGTGTKIARKICRLPWKIRTPKERRIRVITSYK